MSSMAALVFIAVSSTSPPSGAGITAEQAMANYRAMLGNAADPHGDAECRRGHDDEIVVCRHDLRPSPRLPMPDERAEAGEAVHHAGEPGHGDPGPPTGPPSKQIKTVLKLYGLLKGAITGEDTGD